MNLRKISQGALGAALFAVASLAVLGGVWAFHMAAEIRGPLAEIEAIGKEDLALASEIFDRNGDKIGELGEERRYFVALKSLPSHVPQAFVSAEDKGFREHFGIAPMAIVRAAFANLRGRRLSQGASTITQQLARLYFLDQRKSWERKVKEAILAVVIETKLSKDQILELYLNKIYLGNRSYGIEAAARNYFRKDAADLSVGEAALLAGLPKSPSAYAPNRNPKRASERQAFVLRRLEEDGFLAKGDAEAWAKRVVQVAAHPENHWAKAPYFVVAVQKELGRKLELRASAPTSGLKIYTTLDGRLQKSADAALKAAVRAARRGAVHEARERGRIDGALFSIDPASGAVLASVGGSSFAKSQFDRARLAHRRMGSLMVPIYASLALERGYTLASRVGDDPVAGRRLKSESGAPTLYDVIVRGLTFEAAPLYAALGAGSVVEHARRMGLEFAAEDLSLAFGTGEASPEDIARAYGSFVNGGLRIDPYLIDRVVNANGETLYQAPTRSNRERALAPQSAYIAFNALQDAVRAGHARQAQGVSEVLGGMAAATEDLHDAWFVGVLPNVVTTVWLGADTGRTRLAVDSQAAQALPQNAWLDTMRKQGYARAARPIEPPEGLSFARIPGVATRSQPFIAGTEPSGGVTRF